MSHLRLGALLLVGLLAACDNPQPRFLPVGPVVPTFQKELPAQPPAQPAKPGAALLERLGVAVRSTPAGVVVTALDLDGAAAQSGVRVGDVVVGVNGKMATSAAELERLVEQAPAGALRLDLLHGGQPQQLSVAEAAAPASWNALGLQLRELPRETLRELGLPYGLMVSKVRPPATRTRLLPGDVIVGVNQKRIGSVEEFNRLVAQNGAAMLGLLVRRTDSDLYIAIRPGAGGGDDASRGGSSAPRPQETFRTRATGKPLRT